MFSLSDNYHQRQCYLKQEQVPTQSVMIKKMNPPLANVYFKSMRPRLKVLAGLEPPMKGGGSDWFVPPSELLAGRSVLKPMKKQYLSKLGFNGIDFFGERIMAHQKKCMEEEKNNALLESDNNWKKIIEAACRKQWDDTSREYAQINTHKIKNAFNEFKILYSTSITQIETILLDGAIEEIKRMKEEAHRKMSKQLETLVMYQATELYRTYTEKLNQEKAKLKAEFKENLDKSRLSTGERLHDINVEKHMAIEKLRNHLECQNLACRVYVALKEREECDKEIQVSKKKHEKKVKKLKEEIAMKDFEIVLEKEKEKKRVEFNKIWQKKICHVIKRFQMFVAYCLQSLPDHAEFFLNMEKLMMLHLNDAIENPAAESIFAFEDDTFHTPIPRPHPMFLFCDKGFKPEINQNLCPKHCTSSASQFPVIVVNKRCIYAACDNFELFPDKIKHYIDGNRGDDNDFVDDHDYTYDVPVSYSPMQQKDELKLESSLLQILQKEHPNLKGVQTKCCIPHCYCNRYFPNLTPEPDERSLKRVPSIHSLPSGRKLDTRAKQLIHEREPKWESYMDYVVPKKCRCPHIAKKDLRAHLPAYMRNVSIFEPLELPNYEPCSTEVLRKLVRKAQGKRPPPPPIIVERRFKEVSTQYSDQNFEYLCTCLSEEELERLYKELFNEPRELNFDIVEDSMTSENLEKSYSTFGMERAFSLRNLLTGSPQLEEIFRKPDCKF